MLNKRLNSFSILLFNSKLELNHLKALKKLKHDSKILIQKSEWFPKRNNHIKLINEQSFWPISLALLILE